MSEAVKCEITEDVAVLTLNDPSKLNALSKKMISELHGYIKEIINGELKARCLVITGEGRGFCAGANLVEGAGLGADVNPGEELEKVYHPFLIDLKNIPIPLITAVNGVAAGAGCSIGVFGDLVYASKSAYFYQAFKFIGLVPDASSTYVIPRKIGMAKAMEFSLIGEKVSAEKALEWGLINYVVDDDKLMDTAIETAKTLASGPTVALKLIKQLYWDSFSNNFEGQLAAESSAQTIAGKTEDSKIGVMSFIQKKKAEFKGK
jgi:2-(1,2-epoxy-1,2-dihydrophenyl)acetyl-CoA isomerase